MIWTENERTPASEKSACRKPIPEILILPENIELKIGIAVRQKLVQHPSHLNFEHNNCIFMEYFLHLM